ncbi:MAG: hypothetical protein JSS02_18895 [Planctomycetes bacterium]|nr:hypothetical protein [Planctomycetota bacterium]
MRRNHLASAAVLFVGGVLSSTSHADEPPPHSTLTDRYRQAEVAVLAKRVAVREPTGPDDLGSTTYEIVQVPRGAGKSPARGTRITISEKRAGDQDGVVLLLGQEAGPDKLNWTIPQQINSRRYNYLTRAPAAEAEETDQLAYYVSRLEDQDPIVAEDAFTQVARAPRERLIELADTLPRESLLDWLSDPELPQNRLPLYALMLGLGQHADDGDLLLGMLLARADDLQADRESVLTGFLWATGTDGLAEIDELLLKEKTTKPTLIQAALQSLAYLGEHGQQRIPAERVRSSLHLLLDDPRVRGLVLAHLARWKDWSVRDKVRKAYEEAAADDKASKRGILHYLRACRADTEGQKPQEPPAHVRDAERYLKEIRQLDPDFVQQELGSDR